jgi:uncharacterized membrane protein
VRTVDELVMRAPAAACFQAGADVERWPEWLPHYRCVRFQRKDGFGTGLIEMAARRGFGPLSWPVWWVSEMHVDTARPAVVYKHVQGITTGMDVEWTFQPRPDGTTLVRIVHDWPEGPHWPLPGAVNGAIGSAVIGPVFIHHVASRTLAGIRRHVEAEAAHSAPSAG